MPRWQRINRWIEPGSILDDRSLRRVLDRDEVTTAAEELQAGAYTYLFPEVFLRENPGFDVIL